MLLDLDWAIQNHWCVDDAAMDELSHETRILLFAQPPWVASNEQSWQKMQLKLPIKRICKNYTTIRSNNMAILSWEYTISLRRRRNMILSILRPATIFWKEAKIFCSNYLDNYQGLVLWSRFLKSVKSSRDEGLTGNSSWKASMPSIYAQTMSYFRNSFTPTDLLRH